MSAPLVSTTAVQVRKATRDDIAELSQTLASAFFGDPVSVWSIPDPRRRAEILPGAFEAVAAADLAHDEVYTTDDVVAGAVWEPPGAEGDAEQMATVLEEVAGEYAPRLFELFELLEQTHPQQPHYYLFLLATRPELQCRGIGSALMRSVLEICDRDEIPAYLEATNERNRALYLRHGFEVTGEIRLPDGPSLWPMWRRPR